MNPAASPRNATRPPAPPSRASSATSPENKRAMNVTLCGKSAIVTGAASGIGLATVLQFLESDIAGVVAVDFADAPQPLSERMEKDPKRILFVRGDVGQEETARQYTQ